jgi:hypothetical protein
MKGFLRFLLGLLGVIVIALIVLSVIEPKDVIVQRSIVIQAPKAAVFEQIVKFKNWPNWSPWQERDPKEQIMYSGVDGTAGSGYHWIGDPKLTGEGEMKNTSVEDGKLNYDLNTIKPFKKESMGYFQAVDTVNGSTRVTWSITMHFGTPSNAMNAFMDMDKMLGGDFERGLQNMKKYAEAHAMSAQVTDTTHHS